MTARCEGSGEVEKAPMCFKHIGVFYLEVMA